MRYFIPQERTETEFDGAVSVLEDLTVVYSIGFTSRSFDQSIDILLSCYEGTIDVVVVIQSEWANWYNGDDYSAVFETSNTSYVSSSLQITPTVIGFVYVIVETNYGNASYVGSIVGQSMVYDEFGAAVLAIVAIPFIVGLISYTIMKRRGDKNSMQSTLSEPASLE
jgi:ABC-type molybdate transport system permease subunit